MLIFLFFWLFCIHMRTLQPCRHLHMLAHSLEVQIRQRVLPVCWQCVQLDNTNQFMLSALGKWNAIFILNQWWINWPDGKQRLHLIHHWTSVCRRPAALTKSLVLQFFRTKFWPGQGQTCLGGPAHSVTEVWQGNKGQEEATRILGENNVGIQPECLDECLHFNNTHKPIRILYYYLMFLHQGAHLKLLWMLLFLIHLLSENKSFTYSTQFPINQ